MSIFSNFFERDFFDLLKLFDGFNNLESLLKNKPEAYSKLKDKLKGELTFKDDKKKTHHFNCEIKDFIIDNDTEGLIGNIKLNVFVPNLDREDYDLVGVWIDSYCEDHRPKYDFPEIDLSHFFYHVFRVSQINGEGVEVPETNFDGTYLDNLPKDEVIYPLLGESILEDLKRIKKLLV
jgi:hypothetical protein